VDYLGDVFGSPSGARPPIREAIFKKMYYYLDWARWLVTKTHSSLCIIKKLLVPLISRSIQENIALKKKTGLYRRISLFFIHARSYYGGTFFALVAGSIPRFPVTLFWSFVNYCIIIQARRAGKPDDIPGPCSLNLLLLSKFCHSIYITLLS
jgi:hypothetical protein